MSPEGVKEKRSKEQRAFTFVEVNGMMTTDPQRIFTQIYKVVWCGVVWCGVVWCGVVWCGVVWCGVVWCGVV